MKLENFYKEIIDGTTHTLLAPPATYTADGRVMGNFNKNPVWMVQYGWREWTDAELEAWHAQYDPPAAERQRCTRYQLLTCLEEHYPTMLAEFKQTYWAGTDASKELQLYWNSALNLDKNDAKFKSAQQALGITDAQVKEIFSKIEGEEPAAVEV